MNNVNLIGRLCADPELRYTPQGNPVCEFRIAVDQGKNDTGFFQCTAWKNTAETAAEYLKKGRQVGISGRLRFEQWEDRETGKKRSKVTITADRITFIGSREESGEQRGAGGGRREHEDYGGDEPPF